MLNSCSSVKHSGRSPYYLLGSKFNGKSWNLMDIFYVLRVTEFEISFFSH